MKEGFSKILNQLEQEQQRRLAAKAPQWAIIEGIHIPGSLAVEQCSSTAAAQYKASLAPGGTIADLTSGLGIDVWAFAQKAGIEKVYYNDINSELCNAAILNFELLGLNNVEFSSMTADDMLGHLDKVDMIFIDPARRSSTGSKVFRLEDCSPNLIDLLPKMWEHTDIIMAKLSPMADISLIASQLPGLAEIHITGTPFECKELLCIMRKGWTRDKTVTVVQMKGNKFSSIVFENDKDVPVSLADSLQTGDFLLEPNPAMMKSGLYGNICKKFEVKQLDKSTHLFTKPGHEELSNDSANFFKIYKVMETQKFCKSAFKEIGKRYPVADVSARNIPMKSEDLKKRMGISGSSDIHIFGICVNSERILAVCRQLF